VNRAFREVSEERRGANAESSGTRKMGAHMVEVRLALHTPLNPKKRGGEKAESAKTRKEVSKPPAGENNVRVWLGNQSVIMEVRVEEKRKSTPGLSAKEKKKRNRRRAMTGEGTRD